MQVYDTNNKDNYKNFQNTFFYLFIYDNRKYY
jgi:hypothetical protein